MNSERYLRQIEIPEIGEDRQTLLEDASVLVIGAGGVGTTVLYDLAAAGVGTIGIADHEIVKMSNLNRQFIHFEEDIGSLKVNSAAKKLRAFNSEINVIPHATAVNKDNAYELISQYDMVVLTVDNAQARMIVNEACVDLGKPFAYGQCGGVIGACCFVEPGKTPCLACLYGTAEPPEEHFSSCSPVVSVIGGIVSSAVLSELFGEEVPLAGNIITYNAKTASFEKIPVERNKNCSVCARQEGFEE